MTLVMAWREQEVQRVWLVSDSRLSSAGQHGRTQLTDNAAKLLVAPRILRRQTPMNVLGLPVASSDVAFAYAGSSLIALQAYAAILPLWGHLQTSGEEVIPSMRACADHLGIFVQAYTLSVSGASGQLQPCQCAIIGFDTPSQTVEGWIVAVVDKGGAIDIDIRRMAINAGEIELIGSGAEAARAALTRDFPRTGELWHREPLAMIRAHLREPHGDVGGGVQIGYVSEAGFQLSYDVQPAEHGFYAMRYRGFDFNEVSRIGDAFCNLPGLF
jgi:hypothetical protein